MKDKNLQTPNGKSHHLLTTNGLSVELIKLLLEKSKNFESPNLAGKKIFLTSANPIFIETISTLGATITDDMASANLIISSSNIAGQSHFLAKNTLVPILNITDGSHASPLLALAFLADITTHLGADLSNKTIAILNENTKESKENKEITALINSMIFLLLSYGVGQINLICPYSQLPSGFIDLPKVNHYLNVASGTRNADVVVFSDKLPEISFTSEDCLFLDLSSGSKKEKFMLFALLDTLLNDNL